MPIERRQAAEADKFAALVEAANTGFRDIDERRFDEVRDDDLERFVSGLGTRAMQRLRGDAARGESRPRSRQETRRVDEQP